MKKIEELTDEKIKELMLTSKTIQEWNENRETAKLLRDQKWISKHIDQSGLVFKALPNKTVGSSTPSTPVV